MGRIFSSPEGVVPVAAGQPMTGGCGFGGGGDLGEHGGEGGCAGEVDVELDLAGFTEVTVGVVEAGEDGGVGAGGGFGGAREIADDGVGVGEGFYLCGGADGLDFAVEDGDGFYDLGVAFSEADAGVDAGVDEDEVGGLCGDGEGEKRARAAKKILAMCGCCHS